MAPRRSRLLRITSEAAKARAAADQMDRASVDVIQIAERLGFPVLFRPTWSLLGATVIVDERTKGILVTTRRSLGVQRFTLAHELGHILLNHESHFDVEPELGLLLWVARSEEEQDANSFASELLTPRDLILSTAVRHGWGPGDLSRSSSLYQLSLRLGVSFEAMCWSLVSARILGRPEAQRLSSQTNLRQLKDLLSQGCQQSDSWADVWCLTEADSGTLIEAGPGDLFVAKLVSRASAGFLWDLKQESSSFELIRESSDPEYEYGSDGSSTLVLRARGAGSLEIDVSNRRPWSGQLAAAVRISVANYGKEDAGLPRAVRRNRLLRDPA